MPFSIRWYGPCAAAKASKFADSGVSPSGSTKPTRVEIRKRERSCRLHRSAYLSSRWAKSCESASMLARRPSPNRRCPSKPRNPRPDGTRSGGVITKFRKTVFSSSANLKIASRSVTGIDPWLCRLRDVKRARGRHDRRREASIRSGGCSTQNLCILTLWEAVNAQSVS